MGVCNRQLLTEDKSVHCEVESEGSRRQSFALRNTNHIRHNCLDKAAIQVKVQRLHGKRDVNPPFEEGVMVSRLKAADFKNWVGQ